MPGRLFLTTSMADLGRWVGQNVAPIAEQEPRRNIAPGQDVVCLTADGFKQMRWGLIPVGRVNARGRPVMETIINARSETVFDKSAFEGVGRAVVIVDGWYEWTGETRHKTAWRIRNDEPLVFAAITDVWTAPGRQKIHQMAVVTCAPNADVKPIHHRMGVLLEKDSIELWLIGTPEEVAPLMVPWSGSRLIVERATDVDWNAS
ncbi:SOS response-associated peptidase [Shimia sp. NS0008-38b]|uniref:SOS response-associated peptidase n=1 Tax=Shimia sp. NS0008-38b TaxID=3127653 RepID=UPI003109A087